MKTYKLVYENESRRRFHIKMEGSNPIDARIMFRRLYGWKVEIISLEGETVALTVSGLRPTKKG